MKGVALNERGFETDSYNSFTLEEADMLLAPDMARNHLSCSKDSFFGSDMDEEEKLQVMSSHCWFVPMDSGAKLCLFVSMGIINDRWSELEISESPNKRTLDVVNEKV